MNNPHTNIMKILYLLLLFVLTFSLSTTAQSLAVNSTGAISDASAILDVQSSSKGILIPKMTAVERLAISAPANGLMVYQTDGTQGFYYNQGTAISIDWIQLNSTAGSSATLTTARTIYGNSFNGSANLDQAISPTYGGTGVSTLTGMVRGNGTSAMSLASYGYFYDLTNQTLSSANTAYPMKMNTTDLQQGISVNNSSEITFSKAGIYNIQFSAQLDRSTGSAVENVSIWLRKNGVDVPFSTTDIFIVGSGDKAPQVAAWNFFQNVNDGDQIQIMWSATSNNILISYQAERTSPVRPALPSVIVSVNQVY